jgi:hypothetical protein
VLITKRNLQVKDVLAVTLKVKVPRLNDSGVDWADGDLVDFLSLDSVIIGIARHGDLVRLPTPGIVTRAVGRVETHRFQPGMTFGSDAELLGDLALEEMDLGTIRSERWEVVKIQGRPADAQESARAIRKDCVEIHLPG